MKSENDAPPIRTEAPPALTEGAPVPVELLGPALADFPYPMVVTNRDREVIFLNGAAQKLFGETLRAGDPCPLCSTTPILNGVGEDASRRPGCPQAGESLKQVPILLKMRWITGAPLTLNVTPIRGANEQKTGCFIHIREHVELLTHPVLDQQMATLSSILENFPMPFFIVDSDLVIIYLNERMANLTGYSRSEAVGQMTCGQLLNTAQCDTCDCILKQVMEQEKPLSGLTRKIRNRWGQEIPVRISASIITDSAGKVIGGFEAIRDISPLVEAERKFDLLTELTREGIMMTDEKQRILFVNQRMAQIVGIPREEILGKQVKEVLSPQHHRSAKELAMMIERGQEWGLRYCSTLDPLSKSPLDERRVFETCMGGERIGDQIVVCIYLRDLSERIKIGRELQKTNNFLNQIIRCSVDGIVVVDTKGNPMIFNEGAERILGYKAQEVIGCPEVFRSFYPPALAQEMMRRMRSHQYGPPDKLVATQVTFINKDGEEVPVRLSAAMIREGSREVGSVGIFSDLREHLKLRQELEDSQSQLVQAEKIASLGRLSAGVAHEINNPLAGILIYAELLQRSLREDAPERQHLDEIITQTLRCKQIVSRLLEFSRQSLGQKTLFQVNEVISRCVELVGHQALFHNIDVIQDLDVNLPQVLGNASEIQQVFTNLLLNAADAMQGRGKITIASFAGAPGWRRGGHLYGYGPGNSPGYPQ